MRTWYTVIIMRDYTLSPVSSSSFRDSLFISAGSTFTFKCSDRNLQERTRSTYVTDKKVRVVNPDMDFTSVGFPPFCWFSLGWVSFSHGACFSRPSLTHGTGGCSKVGILCEVHYLIRCDHTDHSRQWLVLFIYALLIFSEWHCNLTEGQRFDSRSWGNLWWYQLNEQNNLEWTQYKGTPKMRQNKENKNIGFLHRPPPSDLPDGGDDGWWWTGCVDVTTCL